MRLVDLTTPDGLRLDAALHETEVADRRGAVLLVHGITGDRSESGKFDRLAASLCDTGFDALRFSFRGHGESDGATESVTIAGETIDLETALDRLRAEFDGPYYVVAASFGAVSTCTLLEYVDAELDGLVLWYPVLDLQRTFVEPELPWGVERFTGERLEDLYERGVLELENDFRVGRALYAEFRVHDPLEWFLESSVPALVIHGEDDTVVPFDVARDAARQRADCEFHPMADCDHTFESLADGVPDAETEQEAIERTVAWLSER